MAERDAKQVDGPTTGWMEATWSELRGLMAVVLDLSFKQVVTPRIVRVFYTLSLLAALLSALAWMLSGFREGFLMGIFTLVTGPLAFLFYVLCARVAVELILAVFRIADQLERRETGEKTVGPGVERRD